MVELFMRWLVRGKLVGWRWWLYCRLNERRWIRLYDEAYGEG